MSSEAETGARSLEWKRTGTDAGTDTGTDADTGADTGAGAGAETEGDAKSWAWTLVKGRTVLTAPSALIEYTTGGILNSSTLQCTI